MSNTMWNNHLTPESLLLNSFPPTPTQPLEMYQPNLGTSLGKRPRQLDVEDFTQSKRHESTGDYTMSSFSSASPQNDPVQGLSDEAADVCTTWFNKYAVLPSDSHIDALSQLTMESKDAIRQWFGRMLKQGMGGQDSAYKSQTEAMPALCWSDSYTADLIPQQALEFPASLPMSQPSHESTATPQDRRSSNDTTVAKLPASTLRRGKKQRCTPTDDRDLLARDPNKIYQCTRKCGTNYNRKCDWKRNEEEGYPCKSWVCSLCVSDGVENVRPSFRKYHFKQHFKNLHPEIDIKKNSDKYDEYEQASVVCSETEFPRNCGFCKHKFDSRQDRIDHIADHFKQGKCMLDWNDEGNDDGGSGDNTDNDNDDNDKPSGDGYDGAPSHPPPESDPRDNYGSKYYGGGDYAGGGGGGSSNGGPSLLPDSFFGFKLSSEANTSDAAKQPQSNSQLISQRLPATPEPEGSSSPKSSPSEGCSIIGRHASTTTDDQTSLAGDALSGRLVGGAKFPSQPLVARGVCVSQDVVGLIPGASDQQPFLLDSQTDPAGRNTKNSPVGFSYRTEEPLVSIAVVHDAPPTGSAAPTVQKESIALSPAVLDTLQQFTSQSFLSVRLLGAGGFSTVDEVLHRATNLRLVRKTLKNRDTTAIEELKKEVDVLQKLRHPHIIRFLGAYSKGDKMSILVSPVAETTLALWLEQATLQQPANLVHVVNKMFGCLVSSVRYLHEQRPVVKHMDIKPQNILVAHGDQEFPHVVLCDFGISSSDDVNGDQQKPLTRRYVAPEVLNGFARKQAADIWSLGCVFAEMASAPFGRSNSKWSTFRREYSGRTGKHYWQDVPSLQGWLSGFLDQAATPIEQQVIGTLKGMLSADPNERPSAALLSMEFTPAPCCLEWPNDKVAFPTPDQELEVVGSLTCKNKDCADQFDAVSVGVDHGQDTFKNANSWIEECDHTHDACRHVAAAEKMLPTRLIDTQPEGMDDSVIRIVDGTSIAQGTEAVKYATLSYVWSKTNVTLTSDGLPNARLGLQRHALPTVLQSGIQAAQKLGFRYAWVDSLCILQDSEADKQAECALMASVFRNAALTIVLDQIDELDMQPGLVLPDAIANAIANAQAQKATRTATSSVVLPDANANAIFKNANRTATSSLVLPDANANSMFKNANRATDRPSASSALPLSDFATPGFGWDTRAWSLQERLLSRRLLHLCKTQLYWECASLKASDTFPRGLSSLVWEKAHTKSRQRGKSGSRSVTVKNVEAYDTQTRPETTRLRNCQWIHKEGQEKPLDSPYAFVQPGDANAPLSSKGVFAPKYARKNSSVGEAPCNPSAIEATTTTIATEDRISPENRSRSPFLKGLFALSAMAESRTHDVAANSTSSIEKPLSAFSSAEPSSESTAFSRLHSSSSAPPARGYDNVNKFNSLGHINCIGITTNPRRESDGHRKQQELGEARTIKAREQPLRDGVSDTLAHHLESAVHSHPCCTERGVVGSTSRGRSSENGNAKSKSGKEEEMK
jgi:serine/threonine protein kinase